MQANLQTEISQLLEEAGKFAQQGKREKAYRYSLKATSIAPGEPLGWYIRAQNAPSREEQLMCLSRAYSLDPNDAETKKGTAHRHPCLGEAGTLSCLRI